MKLSVIVPAYNEDRHIAENIRALDEALSALDRPYEIIVVDDASTDSTRFLAQQEAVHRPNVKVVNCPQNYGKGFALGQGFRRSTGEVIGFIDADMDLHPQQFDALIKEFERATADIAIGSKLHPQSEVAYPAVRRFLSLWYRLLVRLLFRLKVRDTQVGLKLFHRAVLEEVMPRVLVKRFAFDLELLALANYYGYTKIVEVPIRLDYQFSSTIRVRDVRNMLLDTLAIFYRLRIKRYYQRPEPALTRTSQTSRLADFRTKPIARWKPHWRRNRNKS